MPDDDEEDEPEFFWPSGGIPIPRGRPPRMGDQTGRHARLAREAYAALCAIKIPEPPAQAVGPDGNESDAHWRWRHDVEDDQDRQRDHATVCVVFAAAAAEAYINDFGARFFGDAYFEKHLDKLDIGSKWLVLPRLATGHEMDKSGDCWNRLTELRTRRNGLAHGKLWPMKGVEEMKKRFEAEGDPVEYARSAVRALDLLNLEAAKFDKHAMPTLHWPQS